MTAPHRINGIGLGERINFTLDDGREIIITATMLTPEHAEELLKLNTRNRPMNNSAAESIRADICDGAWQFTGDTIKIATDTDGRRFLADAQHRLMAIVKAGLTVPVIIVENLDPEVTDTIDQGRPRKVGDILRMSYGRENLKNESAIAAAASVMLVGNGTPKPSRRQVAEYANANFETLDAWCSWAKSISDESPRVNVGGRRFAAALSAAPTAALAMHMTDSGGDFKLVTDFFKRIATGLISDNDRSRVIHAIRKRQANGLPLSRITGGGASTAYLFSEFSAYITAYNRWIEGEEVSMIKSQKHPPKNFSELPAVSKCGR